MNKFQLVTDSIIDEGSDFFTQYDIKCIPLSFTLDNIHYQEDFWKSISFKDFYTSLKEGKVIQTGQGDIQAFYNVFEEAVKQGKETFYLGFASSLSGTYDAGCIAANDVREKYPDAIIYCLNGNTATVGQNILVRHAIQKRDQGLSAKEVYDYIEEIKDNACIWFTVDDLNFLHRGGRLSKGSAMLGSLMGIKPILSLNSDGKIVPVEKIRGRRQSIEYLAKRLSDDGIDTQDQVVLISHANALDDAKYLENYIRKNIQVKDVMIKQTGAVIGSHTGPGALILAFMGNR